MGQFCVGDNGHDLVGIAFDGETKHASQIDAFKPIGRHIANKFWWNNLLRLALRFKTACICNVFQAITMLANNSRHRQQPAFHPHAWITLS